MTRDSLSWLRSVRSDSLASDRKVNVGIDSADTKQFLVPVDCDERSKRLVRWAYCFARRFGAELILVHVYDEKSYAPAHTTPWQLHDLNEGLREAAKARLSQFQRELCDEGIRIAEGIVKPGYVIDEVPCAAKELGVDLIITSTHQYSFLRHMMVGSKAEGILHAAPCPVLVIPEFA